MGIGQELLNAGRRGFAGSLAGGAWLTWALTATSNVPLALRVTLIAYASALLAACAYCVWKGLSLRKPGPAPRRRPNWGFLGVCVLEAAGVAVAINAAQRMNRLDALPDWIGLVIGLHFFGLAKVFRARVYYATGILIILWCLYSWVRFRGDELTVSAGLGVGVILWSACSFNLARALVKQQLTAA